MGENNNNVNNLPPGFRFYPTDEELVVHFLHRKASLLPYHPDVIPDLDLYPYDPWQLHGNVSRKLTKFHAILSFFLMRDKIVIVHLWKLFQKLRRSQNHCGHKQKLRKVAFVHYNFGFTVVFEGVSIIKLKLVCSVTKCQLIVNELVLCIFFR